MRVFLFFILVVSFVSCFKDAEPNDLLQVDDCVEEFRKSMSITSEEAYPSDCLTTFELFECDGGVYFLGCNHCAICESVPLHCDGEYLHKVVASREDYLAYIENSKFVKVVGFIE